MAAVGTLGKPYRIVYTAKNFKTGLTQISCKIIKPDLTISVRNNMCEFEDLDLKGCYYYDFETTLQDQLGDYIVIIHNPEQVHKEGLRITYQSQTQSVALDTISDGLRKNYFGG